MFKYCNSFEPTMSQVLAFILVGLVLLVVIGSSTTNMVLDLYATKGLQKQTKEISNEPTVQPERDSQQSQEASGSTTIQPERQSQFNSQQQENENDNDNLRTIS